VQTFWFWAVCQNRSVGDAVELAKFSCKHTANVNESLVEKRDERRDSFVEVIHQVMSMNLTANTDDVLKVLTKHGITRTLAKEITEIARVQGGFTTFEVVDALTLPRRSAPVCRRPLRSRRPGLQHARPGRRGGSTPGSQGPAPPVPHHQAIGCSPSANRVAVVSPAFAPTGGTYASWPQ
jgi:CBS domain-containing protein